MIAHVDLNERAQPVEGKEDGDLTACRSEPAERGPPQVQAADRVEQQAHLDACARLLGQEIEQPHSRRVAVNAEELQVYVMPDLADGVEQRRIGLGGVV